MAAFTSISFLIKKLAKSHMIKKKVKQSAIYVILNEKWSVLKSKGHWSFSFPFITKLNYTDNFKI